MCQLSDILLHNENLGDRRVREQVDELIESYSEVEKTEQERLHKLLSTICDILNVYVKMLDGAKITSTAAQTPPLPF